VTSARNIAPFTTSRDIVSRHARFFTRIAQIYELKIMHGGAEWREIVVLEMDVDSCISCMYYLPCQFIISVAVFPWQQI
jgi:hypothetical protein